MQDTSRKDLKPICEMLVRYNRFSPSLVAIISSLNGRVLWQRQFNMVPEFWGAAVSGESVGSEDI